MFKNYTEADLENAIKAFKDSNSKLQGAKFLTNLSTGVGITTGLVADTIVLSIILGIVGYGLMSDVRDKAINKLNEELHKYNLHYDTGLKKIVKVTGI